MVGGQTASLEPDPTQVERLRTMIDITRSLTSALDLDETIRGILNAAIRVIPAGATTATLTGLTYDGTAFEGADDIRLL